MLLQALDRPFASYDGVDFSPDFIAAANRWAEATGRTNYRFHLDDIRQFCAARRHGFDIATTLDFSEHVEDALATEIYAAIRDSLRPGGKLYLHTPNLEFLLERAKDFGIVPQFPEHIAVRSGPQTASVLRRAGFDGEQIAIATIPHYNVLKWLHPLSGLPLVGPVFAARLWIVAQA
jgi:SAM-dependent methyltransferase